MKSLLERLFAHLAWADALAVAALRDAGQIDGPARELMAHVLGAEHVWLARLRGQPPVIAVWPDLSVDECEQLAAEMRIAFVKYLESQTDASLASLVKYRNSAGAEFESRVDDILTHVAMHGSYHRGQVALALRQEGALPNPTDYIAYIRGAPTATRKDAPRA